MKKCAIINDLSGFGKCSLTVGIPILSVMGCEAHPLPTAVLSNQTAYDSYESVCLTDYMTPFMNEWIKLNAEFDGILTGFVMDENQIDNINSFIDYFNSASAIVVVDPVMADNGALYDFYTQEMCEKIKALCYKADIITPNISELAILADESYSEKLEDIIAYGKKLIDKGIKRIVATGYKRDDEIFNVVFDNGEVKLAGAKLLGGYYSGTGDILASVIMGGVLRGMSLYDATILATSFIEKAISCTKYSNPEDGVEFERVLGELL